MPLTPDELKRMADTFYEKFRRLMREQAEWWDTNQELLILWGRNHPDIDPAFLEEWDRTPPPLASIYWAEDDDAEPNP